MWTWFTDHFQWHIVGMVWVEYASYDSRPFLLYMTRSGRRWSKSPKYRGRDGTRSDRAFAPIWLWLNGGPFPKGFVKQDGGAVTELLISLVDREMQS